MTVTLTESEHATADIVPTVGVLLAVPTRGYPWYETAKALEPYNPQYILEKLSVASVRNKIVRDFLATKADALVMCDDDVIPPPGFIDILVNTPYDIVAAPTPIMKVPKHGAFLNVFNVDPDGKIMTIENPTEGHIACDAVGSGCILIHRRVLEHPHMSRPFDQQIDKHGIILVGQDLEFCRRARAAGFSIGANYDLSNDHYVSVHVNAVAMAYAPDPEE